MVSAIHDAARSAGCTGYLVWTITPEIFGVQLLEAIKRHARFLKDSGIASSHSSALEQVARAAGFPNWHALHTLVQGIIDDFNPEVHWPRPKGGGERIKPLISAIPFLACAATDCPPTAEQKEALKKVASQLSLACGCPISSLLDMIGKMNGADTWEELLSRRPQEATGPLYQFFVDEDGSGRFAVSSACAALIEQQDKLFDGYHSLSETQQREFDRHLEDVLARRPDFLEGLLARTEVMRYTPDQHHRVGKVFGDAIRQADALMPAGFKGEISWAEHSNRFYHRLLYEAMVWHAHSDHPAKALALARRQLRINRSDNLGVRMWLPVLLCAHGQLADADKACQKMTQNDGYSDSGVELIRAICHFANQRYQESAESLYLALFMFPPLRHVLNVDFEALSAAMRDGKNRRSVSPDPETLIDQYVSMTMRLPALETTFEKWLQLPEVAITEANLANEFHANWRSPNGSLDGWEKDVKCHSTMLSYAAVA